MKISFAKPGLPETGALVVFGRKDGALEGTAAELEERTGGALSRAMAASRYDGSRGDVVEILAPGGLDASRVLLVGIGTPAELTPVEIEKIGGRIAARLLSSGEAKVTVALDPFAGGPVDAGTAAVAIATGLKLRSYRFDKYRTKEPAKKKPSLTEAVVMTDAHEGAAERFEERKAAIAGVFLTRDLTSEPPNVIYPESFAEEIKQLATDGVDVEVLGEAEMKKLGMNALLAVGQGSAHESQLVVMRWFGAGGETQPLAFVGKGVTFDTGGISLKPSEGMDQMKWDMGGAGIVTGLMRALARRKAKVDAVGVVGLVENMPSGRAQRPGDVVRSMSGQTIEVLNTDAEGRLVLADALWYTQDRFKPALMIDLATLTGAMIVSLGHEYAGFFTDDETVAGRLGECGAATGDKVWRMPLDKAYDKLIDTPTADVKNIGGKWAGSITAAQFLKRFTNDVPWAHIDVAGVVWSEKDGDLYEKGATGFGVRLLDCFTRNYESDPA